MAAPTPLRTPRPSRRRVPAGPSGSHGDSGGFANRYTSRDGGFMRPIKRSERGEGNFGCLFGLVLVAIAALVAYKLIPIKVKNAEMRAAIVDEAKSAGTHNDTVIREYIYAKATEEQLPVSKEDIKINR